MPTYLNETSVTVVDNGVILQPGETVETPRILSAPPLTKTNEEPYYNPVLALTKVTAAGAEDKTLALTYPQLTTHLRIQKVSPGINVTAFLRTKTNTPPVVLEWGPDDPPVDIFVNKSVDNLILTFSGAGSCQVLEIG